MVSILSLPFFNYASKSDVVKIGVYIGIRIKKLASLYAEHEQPSPILYLQNVPMRGVKPTEVDLKNDLMGISSGTYFG